MRPDNRRRPTVYSARHPRRPATAPGHLTWDRVVGWRADGLPLWGCKLRLRVALGTLRAADSETACMTGVVDTRASGTSPPVVGSASWGAPLAPHTFENVCGQEFRTLTLEM